MADFHVLADEVFASRMGGPELPAEYVDALADFIDSIPPPERATAVDPEAVARGEALFRDATTQCASCHESGMQDSVDVGTGLALQVPRLAGVGSRAPLMHDGCAPTLRDRFGACGGGDRHGTTSHLTTAQIDDLVAYLETL
jgi:mono/diheme cytochrome c family protein